MVVRQYSRSNRDRTNLQEPRVVEAILSRYRNLIVLAIVIVAQLLLLAWQVRTNEDVRLIRVWAVTAVTPMAGVVEAVRRNTIGFLEDYFILLDVRDQNRNLRAENSRLKIENVYYRNQLQTAERAHVLTIFQSQSPSRTVAARIIGNGTASSAQVVFVDRGSTSGVQKGMAVVMPDGIVGKVIAVYPLAAQILLVTDPTFAVGVESQKGHVHGTLHCNGANCTVDYVQNEEKIDRDDWFYTSGEDRIFPKGFPVGRVSSVKPGQFMKEIRLNLSGAPGSVDEVLVVLEGVHQQIPAVAPEQKLVKMLPPPSQDNHDTQQKPSMATQADKIIEKYREIGKEQGHNYGAVGSTVPNFNQQPPPSVAMSANGPQTDSQNQPTQDKPAIPAQAPPPKPAVSAPAILGAPRPSVTTPPAEKPPVAKPAVPSGPVLPLGAPRKKPTASAPSSPEPQ
jgi:rod shape-determining protein MreC